MKKLIKEYDFIDESKHVLTQTATKNAEPGSLENTQTKNGMQKSMNSF